MARKKITEEKETATEIVPMNPLELRVTKNVVGVLETNIEQHEGLESMASVALGIEPEPQPKKPIFKEYTVTISATEEQVAMLKSEMTRLGIVYKGVIELSF